MNLTWDNSPPTPEFYWYHISQPAYDIATPAAVYAPFQSPINPSNDALSVWRAQRGGVLTLGMSLW